MMAAVRAWLSSIVVVTLLLSVVRTLTPQGTVRRIGTFTGGLALAAAILQPFAGNRFRFPEWDAAAYEAAIRDRQAELEAETARELARQVAERTAALIEETALARGAPVRAEVRTAENAPVPWSAVLYGQRDAGIEAWIASELGIPPERQTWSDSIA